MELTLRNYNGDNVVVDIGNVDDIARMDIEIIRGHEVLEVIHKDFTKTHIESDQEIEKFYDGGYKIYDIADGTNLIDNQAWSNRMSSYDGLDYVIDRNK